MNIIYKNVYQNKKLWNKSKNYNYIWDSNKSNRIIVSSKSKNELKIKNFIIKDQRWFLLNNKNNCLIGYINLRYIGVELNKNEKKLTLFNHYNFFKMYFKNLSDLLYFKKLIFLNTVVLINFHNKFDILRKLGNNNNSDYYWVKKKNNNNKYIIRVINKNLVCRDKKKFDEFLKLIETMKNEKIENFIFKYIFESNNSFYIVYKIKLLNNKFYNSLFNGKNLDIKSIIWEKLIFFLSLLFNSKILYEKLKYNIDKVKMNDYGVKYLWNSKYNDIFWMPWYPTIRVNHAIFKTLSELNQRNNDLKKVQSFDYFCLAIK